VSDIIGNVWEWVDGQVQEGQFDGRALPAEGYVAVVDSQGIVLETAAAPQEAFGADYAKTSNAGVYGIIRGGFYGSKTDAGIFAQNLSVPLDLRADGIGFRCLKSL
jgi:formylglycine-generating enzyme required for sulfatase activity